MFSEEDAGSRIEEAVMPLGRKLVLITICLFMLFITASWFLAGGVPIRSLGSQNYSVVFVFSLALCCSLIVAETWRLYKGWAELRRLLKFLDRLTLRRSLALRGFSWSSVWKMSGNVLEVRYKLLSRQLESMNHTIASLKEFEKTSGHSDV